MTAQEIWSKFGGLIDANSNWLLVNLHEVCDERASKPLKNIRFPYQVMMNTDNQGLPVKFRSLKAARSFFNGEMDSYTFHKLIQTGKAKMYFG
mgnify:CR=1 FL=1